MPKKRLCALALSAAITFAGLPAAAQSAEIGQTELISVNTLGGAKLTFAPEIDDGVFDPGDTVRFALSLEEDFVMRGLEIFSRDGDPVEFDVIGSYEYSFVLPKEGADIMVRSEDHGKISRAEFIDALWHFAGSPEVDFEMPFEDVPEDAQYIDAVRWAIGTGLINGSSATTFTPDGPLVRETLAVIFYRYAKSAGFEVEVDDGALEFVNDSDFVSSWARDAVCWNLDNGIIDIGASIIAYLNPQEQINRFELRIALDKLAKLLMPAENEVIPEQGEDGKLEGEPIPLPEPPDAEILPPIKLPTLVII